MRGNNLLAVMLVGLAAMLLYLALAPEAPEIEEKAAPSRTTLGTEDVDEFGRTSTRGSIEWASWRTPENEDEETTPEPPPVEKDPRLRQLLDGLQNVDVYIEGESHGR